MIGEIPRRDAGWNHINKVIGDTLAFKYKEQFGKKSEGDLSPELKAFREAIKQFPVPLRLLSLTNVGDGNSEWTIVHLDLAKPCTSAVEFIGTYTPEAINPTLLSEKFGILVENSEGLMPSDYYETDFSVLTQVVPFSVANEPERYANELYEFLLHGFWEVIQAKFCKKLDYSAKYELIADPVLTASELLAYRQPLANVRTGLPPTVEEWQSMVNRLTLIPQVPEAVRRTFEIARKLFVFSYYEYLFSTVSQHYAFLSLEAAIQSRWTATLPEPTRIEFSNGTKSELAKRPMHKDLFQYFRNDRKLKVDGEQFPNSTHLLLNSLRKKKLLSAWQVERFEAAIHLRNELSHLEFASVMPPSVEALTVAAELINAMFDSLSSSTAP